jgi:hypothetical protein
LILTLEDHMSDGPYRSLPMRHACKRLAKWAQQSAFDPEQVAEAVCPALEAHWAAEVPDSVVRLLRDICDNRQPSLLEDGQRNAIEAARRETAGSGSLGAVLVDCVEQALAEGKFGGEALIGGAKDALTERAVRDARTIEEHYQREAGPRSAARVHARILDAVSRAPLDALSAQVVQRGAVSNRAPTKHGGLDEGVSLP